MAPIRNSLWVLPVVFLLTFFACNRGGSSGGDPPTSEQALDEEMYSPGALTASGASTDGANPLSGQLEFKVSGASFSANIGDVRLFINGVLMAESFITLSATSIMVNYTFVDGANDLLLSVLDTQGLLLELEETYWAGGNSLDVNVSLEDSTPVSGATVTATLVDDGQVVMEATSIAGVATFSNMPARTFILSASDSAGRIGTAGAVGDEGTVALTLIDFDPPSSIDNNDFHLGTTQGWEVGISPVTIIPHEEKSSNRADWDLLLSTAGEGPQPLSRTFVTKAGTKNVSVRYRFITSEVPGGYFGTKYNDYFSVSIRSLTAKGSVFEKASMNSLGLGAFDANGATAWREKTLPVKPEGDTIQVDVTVANVADGLYDSQVVIDMVAEKTLGITSLDLHDIDGSVLRYLSADDHTYFSGNTRVHGTIIVEGPKGDKLSSLKLEVVQGGAVVAIANVAAGAWGPLQQEFGEDEKVEITTSQLLFELPSTEAAKINGSADGILKLRVQAQSADGQIATEDYKRSVVILVRYKEPGRYGPDVDPRNENEGGDDWGRPSFIALLKHYGDKIDKVGDISNMNAGDITGHATHEHGRDADAWFSHYNARDAATAATFIEMLNDNTMGPKIKLIYVTYQKIATNDFWTTIQNIQLNDNRHAKNVILPAGNHEGHFHIRMNTGW
ncbi:MAG: hypothetical protein ABIK28_24355 [Planctomycetota bacterium]